MKEEVKRRVSVPPQLLTVAGYYWILAGRCFKLSQSLRRKYQRGGFIAD